MSRIGNKTITIPAGVEITVASGNEVTVKGPKGTLTRQFAPELGITVEGAECHVTRPDEKKATKQLHGTTRALLNNMVVGVSEGFEKKLELVGIGFRSEIKGNELVLTQTKDITFEMLEAGEYTLVAYVALASEGIRVTNYQKVSAEITELSRNEQGFKNTIKSNANKELVIISEIDYNLYCEFEGEFTYEMLKEFMGQAAYDHGMIEELKIEMLDGENWIVVDGENAQMYEQGQYRMKYIVNSENQKEAYVFVTIK